MNVLMCCSDLSYKGGMVTVVKGYLSYDSWGDVNLSFIPTHCEAGKVKLVVYFAKAFAKILYSAVRGRIDIAHLHVAERGSFIRKSLIALTLKGFGIPIVLHHHGAEFDEYYLSAPPLLKKFISYILYKADVNIVLSNRLIGSITSKAGKAKTEVVYNAVEVPEENPYRASSRGILFCGRLGHRKGTYDLLEAIKRLSDDIDTDIKFYLCGDGDIEQVKEKCSNLGIASRIGHIGWTDGKLKAYIMRQSMINVLPSYNEGLPMTILETMACGIPSITTRIASIPEVVADGRNGLLIDPGDIDALCDALKKLINDDELRIKLSDESYKTVRQRFSLDHSVARLKEIYEYIFSRAASTLGSEM